MKEYSIVGKSALRVDGVEKVTGKAVYTDDIRLPRMLQIKVLRSPHPHAKILNIDTSGAEKLPGVRCVITGKDVPDKRIGLNVKDEYILAKDVVRAVGHAVAAVAAETREIAEAALDLIEVDYEPLPAVFDAEQAMSTNPPVIIHPDLARYDYMLTFTKQQDPDRPNVFNHSKIRLGDVEKGFREADLVMENRFTSQKMQHATIEPHSYVAQPEADGGLTMWFGSQAIQVPKVHLARVLGLHPSKIRLIVPYVGGGFGGKMFRDEALTAFMALKAGRPVKLIYSREEEFYRGGTRVATIVNIKDGVKKDGTLVARQIEAILPSGGSTESVVAFITRNCMYAAVGLYRIPNFKWDSYGVYVNGPVTTSQRGFGSPQIIWAIESHMTMLANKLGLDPVKFRKMNFLTEGEKNLIGERVHSIGAEKALNDVVSFIKPGVKSKAEGVWRKGKGFVIGAKYSEAPTVSMATVKVVEDGSIVVYHGAQEIGQGCDTVFAQMAAEEFGVPMSQVQVVLSDSLLVPYDHGTQSSRCTFHVGNAVLAACRAAKRDLCERVAKGMRVSPDDLDVKGGVVYLKSKPDQKMDIVRLFLGYRPERDQWGFFASEGEITGSGVYRQNSIPQDYETGQIDPKLADQDKRATAFFEYTAKAVEVAVNTETGQVKVLRFGCSTDMGQPINPKLCEGQSEGGMAMGIGNALFEEVIVEDGVVLNPNMVDYIVPPMGAMPSVDNVASLMAPAPHKDGPYGAKGLGEGGVLGIDAAIADAVYDAVGIRIKDLPITAEKLLKAMKEKQPGV